ncbi:MAG: Tyrosine recombinase XerC [Chloroflexi bacterium ADurb.Bin360]|nr:MAG: Tyrosine recombinase XerC [Chloroflexi bacterium ADurb.Bin360]
MIGVCDDFVAWLGELDRSPATVRAYTIGVRTFERWFSECTGRPLDPVQITPLDIKAFREHLFEGQRLRPTTVNNYLAGVRAFTRWVQTTGLAQHDPAAKVKMLKQAPRAPRWLERSQQFALLRETETAVQLGDLRAGGDTAHPAAVWARRDRAIVRLLLNSGLRLSEATALRIDDVTIRPRSGEVRVRRGKGSKARTVELNADARVALASWLKVRPDGGEALFVSQKGHALSARALSEVVRVMGNAAGITHLHPHLLRHSFAKNLVDQGVGLEVVADLLGHESLETTRIYTTPSAADRQRAVERVSWEE